MPVKIRLRRDGAKIMAALQGRSWTAQPTGGRPITIRFNQPDMAVVSVRHLPELRAAA